MDFHSNPGKHGYANERHTQILIALLKEHGIRKIIASPGSTSASFIGSLQVDPFFELYSSVDERSAAYIAVGLAAESGEPVALVCTGSTASRNYMPGLTEAYYRKLPVLAITASQHFGRVGQYRAQVIDRSILPADIAMESVAVDCVNTELDEWACQVNINRALLALRRHGGGPAHINLVTTYNRDFSASSLPPVRPVRLISNLDEMPSLEQFLHIAILVGVHRPWSPELSLAVESFCQRHDAVVLTSHSSNYKGAYGINLGLTAKMEDYLPATPRADLVIFMGTIPRYLSGMREKEMWRVHPDGEIRDVESRLTRVFAMDELAFFRHYAQSDVPAKSAGYAQAWQAEYDALRARIPELPFSNAWIAQQLAPRLPPGCVFHMGGSNTARAWNYFPLPPSVTCFSNDGVMGIDGQVSSLLGESLASPQCLHFGAVGDLTCFYDMNCLGNRHLPNNFRLLVVNNGRGTEFRIYTSEPGATLGASADPFIAAAGHFGQKSPDILRHYATDLGFEYLAASSKEEFLQQADRFLCPIITGKPMLFEVFTDSGLENEAVWTINHLGTNTKGKTVSFAKDMVRSLAGEKGLATVKRLWKHS